MGFESQNVVLDSVGVYDTNVNLHWGGVRGQLVIKAFLSEGYDIAKELKAGQGVTLLYGPDEKVPDWKVLIGVKRID